MDSGREDRGWCSDDLGDGDGGDIDDDGGRRSSGSSSGRRLCGKRTGCIRVLLHLEGAGGKRSRGRGGTSRGSGRASGGGRARRITRAEESMTERQKKVFLGNWKSNALNFPFAGLPPGPVTPVTDETNPLDVFEWYFTSDVWELIVTETMGCHTSW